MHALPRRVSHERVRCALRARPAPLRLVPHHRASRPRSTGAARPVSGGHLFGCDDCQTVCPFNAGARARARSAATTAIRFAPLERWPRIGVRGPPLARRRRLRAVLREGSPLGARGRVRLARNAAIVLGNRGDEDASRPSRGRERSTTRRSCEKRPAGRSRGLSGVAEGLLPGASSELRGWHARCTDSRVRQLCGGRGDEELTIPGDCPGGDLRAGGDSFPPPVRPWRRSRRSLRRRSGRGRLRRATRRRSRTDGRCGARATRRRPSPSSSVDRCSRRATLRSPSPGRLPGRTLRSATSVRRWHPANRSRSSRTAATRATSARPRRISCGVAGRRRSPSSPRSGRSRA